MKKNVITVLQYSIILLGVGVFIFMLYEPQLEGRNANATQFEIYFNDPFLACVYAASTLFFITLYQLYVLLGCMMRDELSSSRSLRALLTIRYCTRTLILLALVAEVYLIVFLRSEDDIAGGITMGILTILMLLVIAIPTTMLESSLKKDLA